MGKYSVGDRAILRESREYGKHCIPQESFGKAVTIIRCAGKSYTGHTYYHIHDFEGELWGAYEDMLEVAVPLSPFEQKVRAYIQRELPNG